ncbi:MutS family DNA mismatch repair protein [Clostridium polynesiense]|uniref:MutS family DNA mismatch repair protein n=1 Tax=Clostridium polynesiense TaxID=1325933 RepID=UPI0005902102|nr:MutS family DNA mismatch repair protein [Clostridium polynesiense]
MNRALQHYSEKLDKLTEKSKALKREINFLSLTRLIIFLGAAAVSFLAYKNGKYLYLTVVVMLFLALFIYAAYRHSRVIDENLYNESLIYVIKKGIKRAEGSFKDFSETGSEFIDKKHPYSYDLDIFGEASLYQMINSAVTCMGREKLAEELQRKVIFTREQIVKRQKAVNELAGKADFREELEALGVMNKGEMSQPDALLNWSLKREKLFSSKAFKALIYSLNLITVTVLVLMAFKVVDYKVLLLSTLFNASVLLFGKGRREEALEVINIYKSNINTYFKMLEILEQQNFESEHLRNLQNKLKKDDRSAAFQLKKFAKIVNSLKDTKNAYYLLFNVLFLTDYHMLFSLEVWKELYGKGISSWLEVLGEIEALNSLANIYYVHEDWCLPRIVEYNIIEGEEIGHPLIGEEVVRNDFALKHPKSLVLVTGSNMSGKSTFLRTVGINLLLSYLGSAVSAKSFTCGIMDIYTCMRVNDDLKENISSFYAELLRIKEIIAVSKSGKPLFFLMDEIFKGTNSKDRHKGAEVLINQLTRENTIGMVSTHDLELTALEKENSKVVNYHFREYYEDNKLKFDYKLRKGFSTTQNALYLMRMVGIDEV